MSAAPSDAPATVELGGGFIHVLRRDGHAAVLVPHLQSAGVAGMMTSKSLNARDAGEVQRWLEAWGVESWLPLAQVNQVHGTVVADVSHLHDTLEADGLVSAGRTAILCVKAADCAPVWLADMSSDRFALIHAGWRGVSAGIIAAAVDALTESGSKASELAVAVGPHLRPCCFEVGPDVADQFSAIDGALMPASALTAPRKRNDSVALDLSAAIRADLHDLGVREEQIFIATACTHCHPELFHSYRRNGAGGPLMAAIAVRRG